MAQGPSRSDERAEDRGATVEGLKCWKAPGMVVHARSPNTQVAEAGQPGLHTQACVEKLCLKKKKIFEGHWQLVSQTWGLGQGSELDGSRSGRRDKI